MPSALNDSLALPDSPVSPTSPASPEKQLWKKMDARAYRALGLKDDPVRTWILANVYPLFLDAISKKTFDGSRETFVKSVLLREFEKNWDFAGKGYNMGDFKHKFWLIIKNHYDTNDNPSRKVKMEAPTTPTANKPRAVNALSIFRRTHGAAITESANAKLSASQATENPIPHTHGLAVYHSTAREMYKSCDDAVKKNMEEAARLENERIAIGPTETDIIRNQETVHVAVMKQLKSVMGHAWGGHGDMVFFCACWIQEFGRSDGYILSVEPYISAHEDEEVADFNSWAAQILSGEIPFDAEATRSLIRGTANDDTAPVPVLEVHEAGGVHVPTLNVDNTSVDVLRRLLQEYAAETTGGFHGKNITLEIPGRLKTDLEDANASQLRDFYEYLLQVQTTGTQTTEVRADPDANLSDAVVLSAPVATTTELVANVLPANACAVALAPASDLPATPLVTSSPTVEQPGLGPVTAHAPSPAAPVLISRVSGAEPPALPSIVSDPSTPVRAAGPLGMESPTFGPPAAQHQPVLNSSVVVLLNMPAAVVVPLSDSTNTLGPDAHCGANTDVSGQAKRGRKRGADPSMGSKRPTKIARGEDSSGPRRSSRKKENTRLNQQAAPQAVQRRIIRSGPGWFEEEI
ncbi:hypothetical protein DFH08DRAFT_820526 [Mycena albidolilacea]|uniref:Uncharacterized protein n=1 Tax=Mycena albidolilacea TaxID=1033008 RepID=A0AAD7EE42_9AGAR|nr:hypothetical protein DFH08DRAFT_820526 [Mycena albidolilacea]